MHTSTNLNPTTRESVIPVRNAWYLLLYAWNMAEWKGRWMGDIDTSPSLLALLAKILAETTELLIRGQLRRAYEPHKESIRGIRGRIDFTASLKKRSFEKGAAHCSYTQLTVDTLKNRIIRSTIHRLAKDSRIHNGKSSENKELQHQLIKLDRALDEISLKRIESSDFGRLQLSRNDKDYSLPITICYLIYRLEMPTEDAGDHALNALLRDEITFHKLFELFVFNFYRYHCKKIGDCKVSYQETLAWFDELNCPLVPSMSTDITLEWPHHRLVIDTKYSVKTLAESQFGTLKFKSQNLYQIYTYLRTQEHRSSVYAEAEGMLLYPTTSVELIESMLVQGHKIHVATVNLGAPWKDIENRMLSLVTAG